jgi:hypothetical protein
MLLDVADVDCVAIEKSSEIRVADGDLAFCVDWVKRFLHFVQDDKVNRRGAVVSFRVMDRILR